MFVRCEHQRDGAKCNAYVTELVHRHGENVLKWRQRSALPVALVRRTNVLVHLLMDFP